MEKVNEIMVCFSAIRPLGKKKKFEYVVVLSPFVVNVFQNKFTQNLKKLQVLLCC